MAKCLTHGRPSAPTTGRAEHRAGGRKRHAPGAPRGLLSSVPYKPALLAWRGEAEGPSPC